MTGIERRAEIRAGLALVIVFALTACGGGATGAGPTSLPPGASTAMPSPSVTARPAATAGSSASSIPRPTYPADMADQPDGASLKSETYYVVPDGIPARVYFTVPRGGWVSWIGTYNPETKAPYRHVGLSIINVRNLVTDGCKNHDQRQPPVGPTVDDLATALTELPPFEVTIPPQDMTLGRFRGKSLQLRIPDLPFREDSSGITYPECEAQVLKSWIGSPLSYAFYGYTDPGSTETFWILDVEGNRVVISAISSPKSPKSQLDDLRSLMESIRIRPIR